MIRPGSMRSVSVYAFVCLRKRGCCAHVGECAMCINDRMLDLNGAFILCKNMAFLSISSLSVRQDVDHLCNLHFNYLSCLQILKVHNECVLIKSSFSLHFQGHFCCVDNLNVCSSENPINNHYSFLQKTVDRSHC